MQGFKILLDGVFRREQVIVRYKNVEEHYSTEAMDFIEGAWSKKLSLTSKLYDGKLFRFVRFEARGENLVLDLQNTSYKHFVGSRNREFIGKFRDEAEANPVSVGALVSTSDRRFVVGRRRDDLYFNPGKYSIIAGTMDREQDFEEGKPDPFKAILRELEEEKNIQKTEVRDILCLGLIYNEDYRQTYIPFYVELTIPSYSVRNKTPQEEEFAGFSYLNLEEIQKLVRERKNDISQTCLGTILLFEKHRLSGEIFKKNLS